MGKRSVPIEGYGDRMSPPINLKGEECGCEALTQRPHQCSVRIPQSIPVPMDAHRNRKHRKRKSESLLPVKHAPPSPTTTVIHSTAAVSMNSESYGIL